MEGMGRTFRSRTVSRRSAQPMFLRGGRAHVHGPHGPVDMADRAGPLGQLVPEDVIVPRLGPPPVDGDMPGHRDSHGLIVLARPPTTSGYCQARNRDSW